MNINGCNAADRGDLMSAGVVGWLQSSRRGCWALLVGVLLLGRSVFAAATPVSDLDALRYIASYGDLIQAFGADAQKGRSHYQDYGIKEGRKITFDPNRYMASHPDLIRAFAGNEEKATRHYIEWGFKEGRQSTFDPLAYIASYADLIAAFATDALAAARHYIDWGYNEGRRVLFDALAYLAKYADLRAAFGADTTAAARHYIEWGSKEGRTAPTINSVPLANAGSSQTVRPYVSTVILDGSSSADRDGDALTYTWSIVSKPDVSSALLSSSTAVKPSFEPDAVGKYVISLVVSDGKATSAPSRVEVLAELGPVYSIAEAQAAYSQANPANLSAAIEYAKTKKLNSFQVDFLAKRPPGTTVFHAIENNIAAPNGGATITNYTLDFDDVVELPSQLSATNYPADFRRALPRVSIADPFCSYTADKTFYPSAYLGSRELPSIDPKPLPSTIARVAGMKDVWGKPNKQGYEFAPNFIPGCANDVRAVFQKTLVRLKQLNIDTIVMVPWTFFDGSKEVWRIETPEETLSSTIGDVDLRWVVAEAKRNNIKTWISMQIQGALKTPNNNGSSEFYLSTEATPERVLKSYDALDRFLLERGRFYEEIGVDGVVMGGWYWAGFEGILDSPTYIARTRQKIEKLKTHFKGKVIYSASEAVGRNAGLAALIDVYSFGVFNPFTEKDAATVTVQQMKQEYAQQAANMKTWAGDKPVLWTIGAPSRSDYFSSGYLEETFCTAGFGLDGSSFSNKCIQRDKKVDLALQAMIYEANFQALSEQRGLNLYGVTTQDYWMDGNLMPNVTFPNLGFSVRGKPAEYIVYRWFSR
jgi:hypothetical protein